MHFAIVKINHYKVLCRKGVVSLEEVALLIVAQIGKDIVASNEYGVAYDTYDLANILLDWVEFDFI